MNRHSFHILFASIITFITLSSCSVDDDFSHLIGTQSEKEGRQDQRPESAEYGDEIVFSVESDMPARGGETGNRPSGFRITAYDGNVNYFNCTSDFVTTGDNGVTWTSDHRRYWPGNPGNDWKGLDFYAYSIVHGSDMTREASGRGEEFDFSSAVPSVRNFEVPTDIRRQADLIYAVASNVSNIHGSGKVDLSFRHALSKVSFQVNNDNSAFDNVEILSIEIGGVKGIGDYRFPEKKVANESLITFGDKEDGGVWSIPSSAEDEVYAITDLNVNLAGPGRDGSRSYLSESMLMIPQSVNACSGEDAAFGSYIRIVMNVTPKGSPQAIEDTIFVPISINWKEGKSYLYDVSINSPLLSVCECESEFK